MQLDYQTDMTGWTDALFEMNQRIENLQLAHETIGELGVEMVRQNFDDEGGAFKWKDLKPATVAERKRLGYEGEHPILYRSGSLYRSVTFDPHQEYVDIGSNDRRARALFFGSELLGIPERSPFMFRPGFRELVENIYLEHIFSHVVI